MNAKFVYIIMKEYFKDQDKLKQYINVAEQIDIDEMYADLNYRFKRHRKIKLVRESLKYAALILIVLGLPYFFYKVSIKKTSTVISKTDIIKPRPNDARLVFEDGNYINLSSLVDTSMLNKAGVEFDKISSTVRYKIDDIENELIPKRIVVPRGAEINVMLSDGTKVYLNSESELEFPKKFIGKYRKVKMKGEAFYKVKKNEEHPFIVETSHVSIIVTGTKFNIKAYSDEGNIQTTLVEGGVDVYYGVDRKKKVSIVPSQQADFLKKDGELKVKNVDTHFYTAWLERKFVFKDQTLEDIMIILSRWYDIEVFFQNPELKKFIFSGELDRYDSINKILDCIEKTGDIDVKIDNRTVILRKRQMY